MFEMCKISQATPGKTKKKLRFAPSPNGLLHLGHAYSALKSAEWAREVGAEFCLRIEDIDGSRSKDEFIAAIYRDLHWLGLTWPTPVRRQSDHLEDYRAAIEQLTKWELLYPCFATRSDIKAHHQQAGGDIKIDPDGAPLYPGLYKNHSKAEASARIAAGEPYALRLHMDRAIERAKTIAGPNLTYQAYVSPTETKPTPITPSDWGDVIIARKDIPTSYHLAVVIDDESQGMSHICRGVDLARAVDVHRLLQINLGLKAPLYRHHDLVKIGGEKLSKSKLHPSLFELKQQGLTANQVKMAVKEGAEAVSLLLQARARK